MKRRIKIAFATMIGIVFYQRRYLKGRHFSSATSHGWSWITKNVFMQKIVGVNRSIPFPVDFRMKIANWRNIEFDLDDMNIFQKIGNYYQATDAKIHIGRGTQIANGVAIITSNHDLWDISRHSTGKDVFIGKDCWIASNAVILPGVRLGEHTIVGAGAVVTKSFPEGWSVLAGVPAKVIKKLEQKEMQNNNDDGEKNDNEAL